MVTRRSKRLVIEDDENASSEGKADTQAEETDDKTVATSMVDRLKRRAAKSAELAEKNKRKKLNAEENDKSSGKSPNKNETAKQEQSIPKKAKKTQTIPKKSNEDKNGTENEKDKKDTPSLLSGMKKPPMPKANVGKSASGGGKAIYGSARSSAKPFNSSRGISHSSSVASKQTPDSPVNLTSTPPPANVNLTDSPVPPAGAAAPGSKVKEDSNDQFGSGLRQLVFDGLKELCKDTFKTPPERNGIDLFASFLRHKDLNPTTQTSAVSTDNSLQYDFFDVDEKMGTIILQPKIPIFPEDFPAGSKEWPLSWWGIVEPSSEEKNLEEKAVQKSNSDVEKHSKSRRDRIGTRLDGGKEGNVDRYTRDSSRSTRKRSSRDRYEEDHAYYDDYPPWDDHRDRFHGGHSDGIRSGYPPHHPGTDIDYDYDRNGRSPNGYPDSRHPHHRGGGQNFPHRMRDGPRDGPRDGAHSRPFPRDDPHSRPFPRDDPHSRPFPRDDPHSRPFPRDDPHSRPFPRDGPPSGPPPGDFRGGGRPYPAHGGNGPPLWEFPHRDPHGPHGRGPPPLRDDRREHRDRSHRSPHSKSERDDGRHSGRKPSSSTSSRKDRPRSSR